MVSLKYIDRLIQFSQLAIVRDMGLIMNFLWISFVYTMDPIYFPANSMLIIVIQTRLYIFSNTFRFYHGIISNDFPL